MLRDGYGTDWPAPEVVTRPVTEADVVPRNAALLAKRAAAAGWTVELTYARGTRPGRVPKVVDSIAVRCRRGGVALAAVWIDGRFDCAITNPLAKYNYDQLREVIGDGEQTAT